MRVQETPRLRSVVPKPVRKSLKQRIARLARRIAGIDADPNRRLHASDIWRTKDDLPRGIPGVGQVTALTLPAKCPERGTPARREIAALAGLAPLAHDSGKHRGRRFVWGGRAVPRTVLYMADLSARRCNATIETFAQRLENAGKPPKAIIQKLTPV